MLAAIRSRAISISSLTTPTLPPTLSAAIQQWKLSFSSVVETTNDNKGLLSLKEVEMILTDVRADDVKIMPVYKLCDFTDYIVIATGRSPWHVRNIAQALIYKVKQKQLGAERMLLPSVEGEEGGKWVVIDTGSLIIHALDEKVRAYYNLERLWTKKGIKYRTKSGFGECFL